MAPTGPALSLPAVGSHDLRLTVFLEVVDRVAELRKRAWRPPAFLRLALLRSRRKVTALSAAATASRLRCKNLSRAYSRATTRLTTSGRTESIALAVTVFSSSLENRLG